ncbi:unnamed protein product [Pylaiella littoralis]
MLHIRRLRFLKRALLHRVLRATRRGSDAAVAAIFLNASGTQHPKIRGIGGEGAGGFGNFAGADTGAGFGAAPKESATTSAPSWAAIATTTKPAASGGFGSGGGFNFGGGGGFGAGAKAAGGAKPAATPAEARPSIGGSFGSFGGVGQPKTTATKVGFGTGGGFSKQGGAATTGPPPTLSTSTFGTQKQKQPAQAPAGGSSRGGFGVKFGGESPAAATGGGVSFADAAKRGAVSSAWGSGGSGSSGWLSKPPSTGGTKSLEVGTKTGFWGGSGSTFAPKAAEGSGKTPTRSSTEGGFGARKAAGSAADRPVPTSGLPWGGGLLSDRGKAVARKRGSTSGDGGDGDNSASASRGGGTSFGSSSGSKKEKPKSRKSFMGAPDPTEDTGGRSRSRIMGGFGAPPPGIASSDPPTFRGGGRARGATGTKLTSSKAPPTGRSRILGGFGDPPPGASSDPPAFTGGKGGRGSGESKSNSRTQSSGARKIMGGFGGPPPGVSSSPPMFEGGDGGSSGGGFGGTSTGDAAANIRRAQRFAGASDGGGGVGGGGGGGSGAGSSGGGGGGSAEDVQRGSHLDDAEIKQGTVEGMCPLEEMLRRVPGDLHILEKEHPGLFMPDEGDGVPPRLWSHDDLVVKRHQRAAAGTDISKPELLRTPLWLARTVDHLVMNCVDKGPHGGGDPATAWDDPRIQEYVAKFRANNPSRADSAEEETEHDLYNFVWDRFRMVRSDYNMQGYNPVVGLVSEASIVAHERMARWYVLMANRMERNTMQTHRFNLKSIVETLKKLYEFYTIRVSRGEVSGGLASPNEPEIMAYYLLTVLEQDDGVEVQRLVKDLVRSRREEVLNSPEIKGALKIVRAWHAGDYVAFFRAFRQQGAMHRCLLSQYVKPMRHTAITMIAASFADFSLSELMRLLCFESERHAVNFLRAYSLKVSDTGHVHLRMKDQQGKWRIAFRHPEAIPDPPPLQDLVEPKPWRPASEWVCKGDYEPAAEKSHDVTASSSQQWGVAKGAAGLRRATSASSTGPAGERGGSRPKVSRKAAPAAATVAAAAAAGGGGIGATRRSFNSQTGSSPTNPAVAVFPSFPPGSSAPADGSTGASSFGGGGAVPSADSDAGNMSRSVFSPFGGSVRGGETAPADRESAGQQPTDTRRATSAPPPTMPPQVAPPPVGGDFVFAPHAPVSSLKPSAKGASVGSNPASGAPPSGLAFPPLGSTTKKLATAVGGGYTTLTSGTGSHGGNSTAPSSVSTKIPLAHAPATPGTLAQTGDPTPVAASWAATGKVRDSPASPPAGNENATGGPKLPSKRPAGRDPATRDRETPTTPTSASGASANNAEAVQASLERASAAEVRRAAQEDAKRAMDARQRREITEAEETRRMEQAAARQRAAAAAAAAVAAAREAKRVRDAENRAERTLAAGRIVPSDVIDQLPLDGRLRRLAVDRRKALGLRLGHLGVAVLHRRRSAAWGLWVGETRRWVEEQHLIELRNRRFEEHSTLTDHASFLRRNKKRRSLSFDENTATPGPAAAVAAVKTGSATAAVARRHVEPRELSQPRPLDLPTVVAQAVAKNQGNDAEEAFRAVGLSAVRRPGTKAWERNTSSDGPVALPVGSTLSPPHLFWKAVVVAPSRTRGNVGAWLEAKFGGGVGGESTYRQDLSSHGLCPGLEVGNASGVEDPKVAACGSSGTSKLIYRALSSKLPSNAPTRQDKSSAPRQWLHLCVQLVSVNGGCRLEPSQQFSRTLKAASVVVFAATPRDQDRFFWSPQHPKPDWSQAREDLLLTLDSTSKCGGGDSTGDGEFLGVPVLIVISVKDSILQRDVNCSGAAASESTTEKILREAWKGLGLRQVAELGFSFRVALVGLHEFESVSKAAAATAEGLVFTGGLEEACSKDVAVKLAELAELAPRQPLVATRCLQQMLNTAVARATTDDRYADFVGLALPVSRYEDPALHSVVGAATRAIEHVCRLLAHRSSAWPIEEFAVEARMADGSQQVEIVYVPGAARPAGGEITMSPFLTLEGTADVETNNARVRGVVEASGGLPVDWATVLPSFGLPSPTKPCAAAEAESLLRAASVPAVPAKLADAFCPTVLAGKEGSRPMGPEEAWTRVEELEAYLGRGLMSEELRFRLAEALAGGVMMKGPPPPWRTLVRDAVARRVAVAGGLDGAVRGRRQPLVVHFIAAYGQKRLVAVPGLLETEKFPAPSCESRTTEGRVLTPSRDQAGNTSVEARASATLKRVAPLISDVRLAKLGAKHHRTSSCLTPERSGGGDPPVRRPLFGDGAGNSAVFVSQFHNSHDNETGRMLREQMKDIALETEKMILFQKRAASLAVTGDEELLQSFDASLTGSRSACGSGGPLPPVPDQEWVASLLALDSTNKDKAGENAHEQGYEARRQRAAATLSCAEYKCWELREEIDGYRRQEEKIRAQIFNGDPLLPLWGGPGEGGDYSTFGTSPP